MTDSRRAETCEHRLIACTRYISGKESWLYDVAAKPNPWEIADDIQSRRTYPKTGICGYCDKRVKIPYEEGET